MAAAVKEMTDYEKIQQPWTLLQSKEDVDEQIKQHHEKIVVILFNSVDVQRNSIEYPLKEERLKHEGSAVFFKCIVVQNTDDLPKAFGITKIPAIHLYRNGKNEPYQRLVKPTKQELVAEMDKIKKKET